MSAKLGFAANYISKIYIALVGIAIVPLYVRYMGAEAYGLVGFFAMLQSWLLLLDMGLSPMFSRELSRYKAGAMSTLEAMALLRNLEWFFGALAVVCSVAVVLVSDWIASSWLEFSLLPHGEVVFCISVMGVMVGQRWLISAYSSGLIGLDRQLSISAAAVAVATLRSLGVLVVLRFISIRPAAFFAYQLLVVIFECWLNRWLLGRSIPKVRVSFWPSWGAVLKPHVPFALRMAYLSLVWSAIMQTDKLLLSHWLHLEEYGYFSVAVTAANGIILMFFPFGQALQPRITMLAAQGQWAGMADLYRLGTQFAAALLMSAAGVMVFLAEPLLLTWTNNADLAAQAAPVLALYAMGNAAFALHNLAFQVQFAKGITRWQGIGSSVFAVAWLPILAVVAYRYGAVGAGWVWLVGNALFLLFWVTFAHGKVAPEIKWRWLFEDVLSVAAVALLSCLLTKTFVFTSHGRVEDAAFLVMTGAISVFLGLLAGSKTRSWLWTQVVLARARFFAT